jgi:hypothetical protein
MEVRIRGRVRDKDKVVIHSKKVGQTVTHTECYNAANLAHDNMMLMRVLQYRITSQCIAVCQSLLHAS